MTNLIQKPNNKITKNQGSINLAYQTPIDPRVIFNYLDISESTKQDYLSRIDYFINFIKSEGYNFNLFINYKKHLEKRTDYSISTKNKYLATAKIFLKEANRQGLIRADLTQNVKGFKQIKKHKKTGLNDQEITLLANDISKLEDTPANARLKAILSLLIYQGLRQVEITRLDYTDLHLPNQTAFIQGKGQDDKEMIYLHPETSKALKKYIKLNKISDGALFTSRSNNNKKQRLTTRAIRGIVKNTLNKIGIDNSTHGFRHYFTTNLIKRYKGDLLEIASLTRHKSLEMLQVYNDNIRKQNDLPKYYEAFNLVKF